MSILKIVSGGQTGADRGALDAAIQVGLAHGGWVPKGRLAEDGRIPDRYDLKEMPTGSYEARTEQNVLDSDGTLVLSHGDLAGGSKLTLELARKHDRPHLHIDLHKTPKFLAATEVNRWVNAAGIEVLNVAGSRASGDAGIYQGTRDIIESAVMLGMVDSDPQKQIQDQAKAERLQKLPIPPKTVDDAVNHLMANMSLKDKATIANMGKDELSRLHTNLGTYIKTTFRLAHNRELLAACGSVAGDGAMDEAAGASVIIEVLQRELYGSHRLRVVK